MRLIRILILLALIGCLFGCAEAVPPEKSAYVGEWTQPKQGMYLLITQDGSVRYERLKSGATVSLDGPLKGFDGDNFEVGIGLLAKTFVVSKPPYQEGDQWKMVVDEVELVKVED